jgi:hypothetical protein
MKTVWGSIASNGAIVSGSTNSGDGYNFSVNPSTTRPGQYYINFNPVFATVPAVVGSQNNYGNNNVESPSDGVSMPTVTPTYFVLNAGSSNGDMQPRSFAFIAVGEAVS